MKIVIAIDSFKGSLSSVEAGEAAALGIKRVFPEAETVIAPLADGGEGTVEALTSGMTGGEMKKIWVKGPLGDPIQAEYGMLRSARTAVIEIASAAGITLLAPEQRNPLDTTTYGVGEMILDAIRNHCDKFIIGIGGSATNDGGLGMLTALGYQFLDQNGECVGIQGRELEKIVTIHDEHVVPQLKQCTFKIACDVTNPLCGNMGCSAVYGPQKGATPQIIQDMDTWLLEYANLTKKKKPEADPDFPGSGAAGGLGFAFRSYLNATLQPGIDIVLEETGMRQLLLDADYVITGEGRLDAQTAMGKAPIGIARLAKERNIPVLAFSGCVTEDARLCNQSGIDAFFPILRAVTTLDKAMDRKNARENLADTCEQVFRVIRMNKK